MISTDKLLDIVASEAVECGGIGEEEYRQRGSPLPETSGNKIDYPPILFDLELISDENGNLCWVE